MNDRLQQKNKKEIFLKLLVSAAQISQNITFKICHKTQIGTSLHRGSLHLSSEAYQDDDCRHGTPYHHSVLEVSH